MNDKSGNSMPLFFVTESGPGYEEGVYTQEELKTLPDAARPFIISLAVAESMGFVNLDHTNAKTINDCEIFAAPHRITGKVKKLRNVREGTIDNPKPIEDALVSVNKIGNELREKLQDLKQKSTEEGLKAKIEAKKKELSNNKDK